MSEPRMPTALPSPVDRGELRFVAVAASGAAWRWVDEEMVWARVKDGNEPNDPVPEGNHTLH